MSHIVYDYEINIARAIAENRKVLINKVKDWRVYYTTVYGEEFAVPVWQINGEVFREMPASTFVVQMEYHNYKFNNPNTEEG